MTKFLIVANWKANYPVKYDFLVPDDIELAIAAPTLFIPTLSGVFTKAAQDVSALPVGAYTGEIPAKMLFDLGVKYVLIGHSERRQNLSETNQIVEAKLNQAISGGLLPIICAQTLAEIPENIRNFNPDKYLIMYEPFTAISSNGEYHPESPEKITTVLSDWKNKLNLSCRFLYGGSVNPENCKLLIENCKLVSGLVVSHASLDPNLFSVIIKKCHLPR